MNDQADKMMKKHNAKAPFSRRSFLAGTGGIFCLNAAAQAAVQGHMPPDPKGSKQTCSLIDLQQKYPFFGSGAQSGIATPQQRHIVYMTFDLATTKRADLQRLLARWSAAIAELMAGKLAATPVEPKHWSGVALETPEALGLSPAALTVTVGLGAKVFTDTYGLAEQRPPLLRALKQLPSDNLKPASSGGDLSLQACADDVQVAFHAIHFLARIAKMIGAAEIRWMMMGFYSPTCEEGGTARNLLGFKDGTRNLVETADFDRYVWVKNGPAWQHYGSYQVVRKIRMYLEAWDTDQIGDVNEIFGRHKESGAPLSGHDEFDAPDFEKKNSEGEFAIPETAHIRLVAPENNGFMIRRRSYNYCSGIDRNASLDAGLLFISYQNDPAHFETLQSKLGAYDDLNEYITHIGSAIFFVPPRPMEGAYIGKEMFDQ